jgi:hypothetical protein
MSIRYADEVAAILNDRTRGTTLHATFPLCVLGCALSLVLHAGVNILFASVLVNHCQHS